MPSSTATATTTTTTHMANGTLPLSTGPELKFDSIASSIAAFSRGEFIVVLDSTSRENEGDLIIAGSDVTTAKMAFMVRHSSGLICTPIPAHLCASLELPQMVADNADPKRTAYTVSIDAADGARVSTGISAHDRALTCRTLADPAATPAHFHRPGHVFPLHARDGGVRVRPGHTEAAVEFCRLAGKGQVGVICELVEDGAEDADGRAERTDSGMMRRDACLRFGRKWGLKVCTIEDLIEYLDEHEPLDGKAKGGVLANGEVNGYH